MLCYTAALFYHVPNCVEPSRGKYQTVLYHCIGSDQGMLCTTILCHTEVPEYQIAEWYQTLWYTIQRAVVPIGERKRAKDEALFWILLNGGCTRLCKREKHLIVPDRTFPCPYDMLYNSLISTIWGIVTTLPSNWLFIVQSTYVSSLLNYILALFAKLMVECFELPIWKRSFVMCS